MTTTADSIDVLVRIAWLYYMEDLTQKEIAQRFNISRIKVVRLLQKARECGIVEVRIKGIPASRLELEQTLRARFGLADVRVIASPADDRALRLGLAAAAAAYLGEVLRPRLRVGLGLGRTLAEIPNHVPAGHQLGCHFLEMVGGIGRGLSFDSYRVSSQLAEKFGGDVEHIYTPVVVESPAIRDAMLRDPQIQQALDRAAHADLALVSVGSVDHDSFVYQAGLTDDVGLRELAERAVGDVLGHFFDVWGRPVASPIDGRLVGLELAKLKAIPCIVCVAGGQAKVQSLLGAIRGSYITVLVTDENTALALLKAAA